jgi:hypothetical protein
MPCRAAELSRWDGPALRLYTRNAYDWTVHGGDRGCCRRIKAKSFTIDGEAVVLGPDGLSRFEELSRREATRTTILYAFDLIEHHGEDLRNLPSSTARPCRRGCCAILRLASCLTNNCRRRAELVGSCVPAWGRGHRLKEGRSHVSIRPVPCLEQGPGVSMGVLARATPSR